MKLAPAAENQQTRSSIALLESELREAKNSSRIRCIHAAVLLQDTDLLYLLNLVVQRHGRIGRLENARLAFDSIPTPNSFSWTIMLQAYAQHGQLLEAEKLFDQMPFSCLVASTTMIKLYDRFGSLCQAKLVFDNMAQRNIVSWTAMLAAYARRGQVQEACFVLDRMPERNLVCWNVMIAAYSKASLPGEAQRVFDLMSERDLISWTSLLTAYSRCGGFVEEAGRVFRSMPEHNACSCNVMIQALVHAGRLDDARRVLDGVETECRDVVTWNSMLEAASDVGIADKTFRSMPGWNLTSWNVLLAAYADKGEIARDLLLNSRMPEWDLVTWNTLLSGYAGRGELLQAKSLFDSLCARNLISWLIIVSAFAREGQVEQARALVDQMPEIDVRAVNIIIQACGEAGELDDAVEYFLSLRESNMVSWTSLLAAYANSSSNDEDEAWSMFHCRMPHHNVVSSTLALLVCVRSREAEKATMVIEGLGTADRDVMFWNAVLLQQGALAGIEEATLVFRRQMPARNLQSWNVMLRLYTVSGRVSEARSMLDFEMPQHDVLSWNTVLAAYARTGDLQSARAMFDTAAVRDRVSWNTMMAAYARNGDVRRVGRLFETMPLPRNSTSWNILLAAAAAGDANSSECELREVLCGLVLQGLQPERITFSILLSSFSHLGLILGSGPSVRSISHDHGVRRCEEHYTCMRDVLCRSGLLSDADDLSWAFPHIASSSVGFAGGAAQVFFLKNPHKDAAYVNLIRSLLSP